ncbi:MAG: HAD family phosphatase [Bryobacteraceae bacterium]|nr:HAD family phosphatase [Bryobacteraceae bacterium]
MLKTIIFDLGNVIVPLDFPAGYQAWSEATGLAPAEIQRRLSSVDLYRAYEAGEMSTPVFQEAMQGLFGIEVSESRFMDLWSSIFAVPTLVDAQTLIGLKQRYRLVLLSNTNDLHFRFIRRNYPVAELFDAYVLSYEVGLMKPEPGIYRAAIEASRCAASECFFTDDLAANIEAARLAGMDGEVFTDEGSLLGQLRARGVVLGG